jgi:hypothetical protein
MPIGMERDMAAYTSQQQAAMYRNRRRRLARVILQALTPWATGLTVTAGQYVSGENGTALFKATTSGVTAGTGPLSDGGVTWVRADIQSLLAFLNVTNLPTP